MKKNFKKIISFLVMAVMVLAMAAGVIADEEPGTAEPTVNPVIDTEREGSVTVYKFVTTDVPYNYTEGTGKDDQTVDEEQHTPLENATFKLFRIADAAAVVKYYNGTDDTNYNNYKTQFSYDGGSTATYGNTVITADNIKEATTDADGMCKFEGLEVGFYILKEVAKPDQVKEVSSELSLISIPMVNSQTSDNDPNNDWMYDVTVYPKNVANKSSVEVTKTDAAGTPLANVTYLLFKKDYTDDSRSLPSGEWTEVTDDETIAKVPASGMTGTDGKLKFDGLTSTPQFGTQYMMKEVYVADSSPEGYIVNSDPIYFYIDKDRIIHWNAADDTVCKNANTAIDVAGQVADNTKLSFTMSNERPTMEKKVLSNPHANNGTTSWENDAEYQINEEITYRILVTLPDNVNELKTFTIADTPSKGITDTTTGMTVKYGASATACNTDLSGCTITPVAAGTNTGAGFVVTLNAAQKTALFGAKYLEIQYKAKLNKDAVIAGAGNENTATFTYSRVIDNASADTQPTYAITDHAKVFTYQYEMTKHLDTADGTTAKDVEFELLDSEKNIMTVVLIDEEKGIYRLAETGETGVTTLKTVEGGKICIQGLENDVNYYLKETKTVANYNLLSEPFKFTLNATETTPWTEDGSYTSDGMEVKTAGTTTFSPADAKVTGTIINKKGFVLPQTGSMGFVLFGIVGIALVAGGMFLLFGGKKRMAE